LAFLTQNKVKFWKSWSQHWYLRKTPIFSENWQKSQKIVIISSTPGLPDFKFQKSQIENILEVLGVEIAVTAIWYILRPFGTFYGHLVYLRPFVICYGRLVYFVVTLLFFSSFGMLY
jgi:hypothetical protein